MRNHETRKEIYSTIKGLRKYYKVEIHIPIDTSDIEAPRTITVRNKNLQGFKLVYLENVGYRVFLADAEEGKPNRFAKPILSLRDKADAQMFVVLYKLFFELRTPRQNNQNNNALSRIFKAHQAQQIWELCFSGN